MYVKIRHLTKTIKRKVVLRDVNAEFERGNIYGIVGPLMGQEKQCCCARFAVLSGRIMVR